jgi:hypothetical protein
MRLREHVRFSPQYGTPIFALPSFLASAMVIGTRKTNSNVHPGAILQNNRKPRHTRKQIEEDKTRAVASVIAAEEEAAAKYQSTLA